MSPWPEGNFKLKKPENRFEWSVWIAIGTILLALIGNYIIDFSHPQSYRIWFIVTGINLIGWSLLAVTLMRAGMQLVRSECSIKRGRKIVIISGILFLILIASSVFQTYVISVMVEAGSKMSRDAEEWNTKIMPLPDLSADSRELLGKSFAQIKFIQDGMISEYINASGNKIIFVPNDEDLALRKAREESITALRYAIILTGYWCLLFIVSSAGLVKKKQRN